MSPDSALAYVKARRSVVDPIPAFRDQLLCFYQSDYTDNGETRQLIDAKQCHQLDVFDHKMIGVNASAGASHISHLLNEADQLPRGELDIT